MRIGVLGNCQASGFAASLRALLPGAEVVTVSLARLPPDAVAEGHARDLAACDMLFSQHIGEPHHPALRSETLRHRARRLIPFPAFVFTGFHPDCVSVRMRDGNKITGPLGEYHSALAAACFLEGLPMDQAIRLFNAHTYANLGYFAEYDAEYARLSRYTDVVGYDLEAALREAPAVFMHSVNHPKIEIIFAFARQALRKAALPIAEAAPPEDDLARQVCWAVYPEIGRRIGAGGPSNFVTSAGAISIPEMVATYYGIYGAARPGAWPPALDRARAFLREHALGLPAGFVPERPASREDVRQAFRLILGRDAEDEAVERCVGMDLTPEKLRVILLNSPEFRTKYARLQQGA